MPFRPLISKIRCHNPNKRSSSVANKNYLTYIATREGVDINDVQDVNALLDGKVEISDDFLYRQADDETYLKYMADRPRSHGLFGNIDVSDLENVAKQVSEMTKTGKNIYRGIISLSQKDAEQLGYCEKGKWDIYLRSVMPDLADELGIGSTNYTWVAAFHAEKTHPHIHFEMWDNGNKVRSSFIHVSVQNRCRELLSKAMFTDEYELTLREIQKSEREELYKKKNDSRQQVTDYFKNMLSYVNTYVPGSKMQTLPDRMGQEEIRTLSNKMMGLVSDLPSTGRINYQFMPPEIKKKVDDIFEYLTEKKDIGKEVKSYMDISEEINKISGRTLKEIESAKEDSFYDIKKRIGNIILKNANKLRGEVSKFEDMNQIDNELLEYEDEILYGDGTFEKMNIKKEECSLDEAVNKYSGLLEEGVPERITLNAKYRLGKIYSRKLEKGESEEHLDLEKGIRYLEEAASKEHVWSKLKLGNIYLWRMNNEEKGISYLKEAADQGCEQAKDALKFYENYKVSMAFKSAYDLFRISYDILCQNRQEAEYRLSLVYRNRGREALKEIRRKNCIRSREY